jgi:hypothetical protein
LTLWLVTIQQRAVCKTVHCLDRCPGRLVANFHIGGEGLIDAAGMDVFQQIEAPMDGCIFDERYQSQPTAHFVVGSQA